MSTTTLAHSKAMALQFAGETTKGESGASPGSSQDPQIISQEHRFISLSVGSAHSCGLSAQRQIYCWGSNHTQQLAKNADSDDQATPLLLDNDPGAAASLDKHRFDSLHALGDTTCGLKGDGKVICWGSRSSGLLGDNGGTSGSVKNPVLVQSDETFVKLGGGLVDQNAMLCALTSTGSQVCWGSNQNFLSGIGSSSTGIIEAPLAVKNAGSILFKGLGVGSSDTTGARANCSLADGGRLYCWGRDESLRKDVPLVSSYENSTDAFFRRVQSGIAPLGISATFEAFLYERDTSDNNGDLTKQSLSDYLTAPTGRSVLKGITFSGATCLLSDNGIIGCKGSGNIIGTDGQKDINFDKK